MSLYVPAAFKSDEMAAIAALLHAYPFASLLSVVAGEPLLTHLPLLWDAQPAPHGRLLGHLAAANPHAAVLTQQPALAVFLGPHAYVSPAWYPEAYRDQSVPTWNYAAVHAQGQPRRLADDEALALLDRMTATFEAGRHDVVQGGAAPWRRQTPAQAPAMLNRLAAIVAFEMPISQWLAKFKMSQNRAPAQAAGVVAGLQTSPQAADRAVAEWMQTHVHH